jgi:hypothetical protein
MNTEDGAALQELNNIIQHAISMELRVPKPEAEHLIGIMETYGFKYKNSWASMELPDHLVLDFWKKELLKSAKTGE